MSIELFQMGKQLRGEHAMLKEMLASHAAVLRNTVEIAVGKESLGKRRERDEANAVLRTVVEYALILRRMVEHIETALIYQERNIMFTQIPVGYLQRFKRPTADADIQRLALTHDVYQSLQSLFERSVGVVTVAVEEVDIVEMHSLQTLVETRHERLSRTPVAVRTLPHLISRLRSNEEFVAIRAEVIVHESAQRLLGTTVDGTVIVGEVEMGDAMVESAVGNGAATLIRIYASEVVPEP